MITAVNSQHFEPTDLGPPEIGTPEILGSLSQDLGNLSDLIGQIADHQYSQSPVGPFESSIGQHVRHCLDHVEALLSAFHLGRVEYDNRQRGSQVESDRAAAISVILHLRRKMAWMRGANLERPMTIAAMLSKTGPAVETETTFGRELVFVLNHTTHHNAMIAAMCRMMGVAAGAEFGVAPSTAAHRERLACAPSPSCH